MKHILHKAIALCGLFLSGFLYTSGQTLTPYEQIGKMILQNQTSIKNPNFTVPQGTVNVNCYLTTAIAAGDAVQQPLSYFVSSAPTGYYVNYSLTPTVCERGKEFQLHLIANKSTTGLTTAYAYAFADWNRDGVFETSLGKTTISGLSSNDTPGTSYSVSIPGTADLGKTRIRIYLTTANLATVNPTDVLASGYIYDFVLFTAENQGTASSALIAVSSNNTSWGNAIVQTASPTNDGKYPVGSSVTVQAIPTNNLSSFVGWSDGTNIVSTNSTYTFNVVSPVYYIAIFNAVTPILEAPKRSTAEAPIWYQIKNAQTDTRADHYFAYDVTIPAGYITKLRAQKPVDTSDKFLWRLDSVSPTLVKLVNKGTNMQIYSAKGATGDTLVTAVSGSNFQVQPSGNNNGSYSILYNGVSTALINCNMAFNLALYNGGVGTGSGWYFYRVPNELLNTGFISVASANRSMFKVYSCKDKLCIDGLDVGSNVAVYDMLGHKVTNYNIEGKLQIVSFGLRGAFAAVANNKEGALISACKFIH